MTTDIFVAGLVGMSLIALIVAAVSFWRTDHEPFEQEK